MKAGTSQSLANSRGRLWLYLLVLYLLVLHAALLFAFAKPDLLLRWRNQLLGRRSEVPAWYQDVQGFYQRQDAQLRGGRLVFIGDSHVQGLAVSNLASDAINFGIGGDTSKALLARTHYRALQQARAIVLVIGTNDLLYRDDAALLANVRALLARWSNTPVILSTILPVDDRSNPRLRGRTTRLATLAKAYANLCTEFPQCRLLDSYHLFADAEGRLAASWHEGDGIHLNSAGYQRWQMAIAQLLADLSVAPTR